MRKKRAGLPGPVTAKATGKGKISLEPSLNGHVVSEHAIRLRAYLKWEATGKPSGDGVSFWLEAERELGNGKKVNATIGTARFDFA